MQSYQRFHASATRTSASLEQTAHVRFRERKRVHTRLSEKNRTQGHTRRNRGLPSLGHSATLCCQRNSFYSATLLYTYISRFSVNPHYQQREKSGKADAINFIPQPFFILLFNFSHKWSTFAFTGESGYTLGFAQRIAHKGLHGETGGVLGGGGITTLGAFHTVRKPCVAGYQNGVLCRFWVLPGVRSRRTQRAFGTAMRLCVSLSRGVAAPLGCVIFSVSVEITACAPCSRYFFQFSRRSSLCCSCASCVSARSFSARS